MYDINQVVKLKHFIENKIYLVLGINILSFLDLHIIGFIVHVYQFMMN